MEKIKVILGDDHDLIRQGLMRILDFEEDIAVVENGKNGLEVLNLLQKVQPDIVILDVNMPIINGLEALSAIKKQYKTVKVIILTIENDRKTLQKAMSLGCDGYILKESSGEVIAQAIRTVKNGGTYIDQYMVNMLLSLHERKGSIFDVLTPRELDVLIGMSRGKSNKQIGESLYLAEKTIKNYANTLFKKLEVEDRVQAILVAVRNNIEEYVS